MRILILATDAHGGFGGIAQYNCDVIDAMSGFAAVERIVVLPRLIVNPGFEAPYKTHYVRQASHGLASFLLCSALEAFRGATYDLIYCAHINLLPVAGAISRLARCPLVLTIYGEEGWRKPGNWLATTALSSANLIISISQLTLDRFLDWAPRLNAETAIVPNAVRAERYALGAKDQDLVDKYGLAGHRVLMTLGRMDPDERAKGFDEIIDLMPRLLEHSPDLVYLCAGDGGDRPRLEAKARFSGVGDKIIFTGRIPESRKADYFRLADAYVMPSRWEGFGFVILEALACGVPVVASTVDGTREAVMDGELGLLADPGNPDDLERAIVEALRRPKAIPDALGYFSFANFAKRLEAALSKVVAIGQSF